MKYIITSIQCNAKVNKNLLRNLLNFAKEQKVDKIYAFLQQGKYKEETQIDPIIFENGIELIGGDFKLNNNLKVYDTRILPQQIDPFFGMNRKLSRDYSYILPSPKIRMNSIANTSKFPRALYSTGALTEGNYKTATAHGRKAEEQHQFGFVFVEVVNNQIFHAYQIEANKEGNFHHLRRRYHNGTSTNVNPEALVLGDWHTGDTDPWVRTKSFEMIKELNPKRVVLHDLFNGHSINHHERGMLLSELRNIRDKRVKLEDELRVVYQEVWKFAKAFPKTEFIVARSNHDDFLEKYINHKKFIDDPVNFIMACKIVARIIDEKKVPLYEALSIFGEMPSNFHFAQQDESYRVFGVELANHGHLGANGSKGSPRQFNSLNLKMITGHTHTPQVMENGTVVGTSTKLKLNYTNGASSWLNAHCVLYQNGKSSLLTLIR